MRNTGMLIGTLLILSLGLLAGCKSKEEKAAELIKTELSKTLYDFDSYQPIETIVKEAKATPYNDSLCWAKAGVLAIGMEQYIEKANEATNSVERAQLWGAPTYYSSSYSDRNYYKYLEECRNAISEANLNAMLCNLIADSLANIIQQLDTTAIIGWEVQHSFRCKTRGGSPEIAHYRYVVDKKFKNVLLREDSESETDKHVRDALSMVVDGWKEMSIVDL